MADRLLARMTTNERQRALVSASLLTVEDKRPPVPATLRDIAWLARPSIRR